MKSSVDELFERATVEILAVKPGLVLEAANLDDLLLGSTRKTLFFDEDVPIYIILHLPSTAEFQDATSIASRTSLVFEAIVNDASARTNAPSLARQDSYAGRQAKQDQGQVIHSKSLKVSSQQHIGVHNDHQVIVWYHSTFLRMIHIIKP